MSGEQLKELIAELESEKSVKALRRIMNGFCEFIETCVVNQDMDNSQMNQKNKAKGKKDNKNQRNNKV